MRGTDSAALASVVGALNNAAAAGEVTDADTLMQYLKQLINILIGTPGIGAFPAEAAPANGVSLAEVIRAIHVDVTGLNGDAMKGTDGANTTVPDVAGTAATPAEVATALTDINLDHLMKTAVANNADMTTEVADGTVLSNIISKTSDTSTYAVGDDSLEANRDHIGDGTNLPEAGGDGDQLTAINLPNQTMDITGNLSGSVGSVSGAVGSVAGNVDGLVSGTVAGKTPSEAGDAMSLAADAIKAVSYDESTAWPITASDAGATQVARVGADGDTLETLSDQIDGTATPANVNAEVVDALATDTYAEPGQEAPGATVSLSTKISYLYKFLRNKITNDGTDIKVYNDAEAVVDQKSAVSEVAGTVARGEFGTGP